MISDENTQLERLSQKEWIGTLRQSGLGQQAAGLRRWVSNHSHMSFDGTMARLENAENRLKQTFANLGGLANSRRGDYVEPPKTTTTTTAAPETPVEVTPPAIVPPKSSDMFKGAVKVKQFVDKKSSVTSSVSSNTITPADSANEGTTMATEESPDAYGEVVAISKSKGQTRTAKASPNDANTAPTKKTSTSAHGFKDATKVKQYETIDAKTRDKQSMGRNRPKRREESKGFEDVPAALNYHPHRSPRNGTDISTEAHQMALLRCPNQSKCIVPELQLKVPLKIYYCRHPVRSGVRFYFLMREGLLLHPNVQLLEERDMHLADYVIYLPGSAPWHKTECTNISLAKKMIVLDEFDGPTLFFPRPSSKEVIEAYGSIQWYFMYYKRSFVNRMNGRFIGFPHFRSPDVYPMTYALAEVYTQHKFNFQREIEILCTLRGSPQMPTRQRVQDWVAEYGKVRNVKNIIGKQVNGASRTSVSKQYFEQMYNSQIIVTVNPAHWEGDFRLWESFATGALVMVDPLFVPHTNPLIDGQHVVYFSNDNKTDLFAKLDYYRAHRDEARRIAINGYLHTMKYHRTVNLVDYILRSAHLKRATMDGEDPLPHYKFSAQYIVKETKAQEKEIKEHKRPVQLHPHGHH